MAGIADGEHALGDVLAEIADPLEIGRYADRADDLAQIVRHRLALGDQRRSPCRRSRAGHRRGRLSSSITFARQRGIGVDQRRHRLVDHALGMAAHGGDTRWRIFQILVECANDV